ncbi:DUF2975 domain-containing protein [Agrilactobacillus fermenti]|uniref:DUF2975 domain-containing protein n=1 Tax=Agrilactobacillus fermenti TaxID=2586909 RepID=UPI003A5BD92A
MHIRTTLLKIILGLIALFILFLGVALAFGLHHSIQVQQMFPEKIVCAVSLYLAALLALGILLFIYRLLKLIDQSQPFSTTALTDVQRIKVLTLLMFVDLWGTLPFVYRLADTGDAPGLMVIGLGIVAVPFVVAVFVSTIEKLLRSAIALKHEHDLTV